MIKKLSYYPPDKNGDVITYKTGEDCVQDIIVSFTNGVTTIYFTDGAIMIIGNMPFEYSEIPREAEND